MLFPKAVTSSGIDIFILFYFATMAMSVLLQVNIGLCFFLSLLLLCTLFIFVYSLHRIKCAQRVTATSCTATLKCSETR